MPEPLTYSVPEAAERIGVGRSWFYERVKAGDVPSVRLGRRVLIPRDALDRWYAAQLKASRPPTLNDRLGAVLRRQRQ